MWAEIWECIVMIVKLFAFLGIIGFLYYLVLVAMGLANIMTMITSSAGLFFLYVILGGRAEMTEYWWIWNPACLMLSPALALGTVVCIWFMED